MLDFSRMTIRLAETVMTVILLLLPSLAIGTTYYVDDNAANNSGNGLTPATAWKSITHAAATVPAGTSGAPHVIMVAAGTYDLANGESFPISFAHDYVSLTGAGSGTTTIDGFGTVAGTNILDFNAKGISVSGFTFDNITGQAVYFHQGGFTISNTVFTSNTYDGVYFYLSTTDLDVDSSIGNMSIANNTINSSHYGVYIDARLDFDELTLGLTASIGNLNISNNSFTGNTFGAYMSKLYIEGMLSGTASLGNATFDSNTFTNCNEGLFFDDFFIGTLENSSATVGNVLISNNSCDNVASHAIYVYGTWIEHLSGSTGTLGNLTLASNTVTNCGSYGFDLFYYGFNDIYDNSTVTGGNATISGNTISGNCGSIALYFSTFRASNIYSSTVTLGNLIFNSNSIDTTGFYGLYPQDFYTDNLYGSQVTMGDLTVSNNTITNQTGEAFTMGNWSAYTIHGPSIATLGNINVTNNTVSAGNDYGLKFYELYPIYEIYDTSIVTMGTTNITGNTVTSYDNALYMNYDTVGYDLGEYSYETPQVTTGTTNITNNIFTSTDKEAGYFQYKNIGYGLYGKSETYIGATNISGNTFTGNNEGLYMFFDECAYEIYDTSKFQWNPITIHNNTITSTTSAAFYLEYNDYTVGSYMYDQSNAMLPDWNITNNSIDSQGNGDGFYFYNRNNPYQNENYAYVDFGSILIDGNTFNPNKDVGIDDGIYINFFRNGNDCYDHTTTVYDGITVSNNDLYNIGGNGIYLDYNGFPYSGNEYNTFAGGDFSVTNNMIDSAFYGINLEFDAIEADDYMSVTAGTFTISGNTLGNITGIGIYVNMETVNNNPTDGSIIVGATTITDNTITADTGGANAGIYFYANNDLDEVTFGMPVLSRNTISGFVDGIDLVEVSSDGFDAASLSCNWLQYNNTGLRFKSKGKNFSVMKNAITGNTAFGLSVDNGFAAVINAEVNWWGDVAGPAACATCNGVNPGDSGTVDLAPWLTYEPDKMRCGIPYPWVMMIPAITGMGATP